MDFFAAQARARRQSTLLGWAFAACMLAVIVALNLIAITALRVGYARAEETAAFDGTLLDWTLAHPGTVLLVTLLSGGFIGVASLTRMLQLREGGGYVARSMGGVRVERGTPDPRRRQLHNIVEEMALASGVPVPEVYVLEQEDSINAFAAGHTPANAAVAVTRGALTQLNRDQLQGVIAHEFSHILNGDMRLSVRLMSMVFGLMAVALAGRTLLRLAAHSGGSRSSRDRGAVPLIALGAAVAVVGQIGFWAGRILQAWISRQRECLADASAVQFTRNPLGLRDALVRIAAQSASPRLAGAGAEEIAHMLMVPGTRRLLATHPPLQERIRELDPSVTPERLESMVRQAREQMQRERKAGVESAPAPDRSAPLGGVAVPAAAALIAASTGEPAPRHLEQAVALRHALPEQLRASAEQPERAQALLLALVIFTGRQQQRELAFVAERLGEAMAGAVQQAAAATATLPPLLRLPAVLQLVPALRALPPAERLAYVATLRELVRMDGSISVFEYALEKIALRALLPREAARAPHGRLALDDCSEQLGVLFSVLARHGARGPEQARQAYEAGLAPLLPRHRPACSIIEDWVPVFDAALDKLRGLSLPAKQLLVESLVRTIAHDATLSPAEAELLRAICAVLECPLPPVLPPAQPA